jgi:hypothetical protein
MVRPLQVRPLFSDKPIREALDDQRQRVAAAIAELPPDVLLAADLDDLTAKLVARFRLDPLVLNWDAMKAESREVEIDAGGDGKRGISDPTGPFKISGTEITYFVPFSSRTPGLFDMRPSTHAENPPRGFVRGTDLTISYSGVDADEATVRTELDRQESDVKAWVAAIKTDVDAFNTDLLDQVRAQLKARFDRARARAYLVAALGVPLRQRPQRRGEDSEAGGRRSTAAPHHESAPGPRRHPGRPAWTRELLQARWREAQAATPQPQTLRAMAEHFRALDGTLGGISGEQLGRLNRKWRLE